MITSEPTQAAVALETPTLTFPKPKKTPKVTAILVTQKNPVAKITKIPRRRSRQHRIRLLTARCNTKTTLSLWCVPRKQPKQKKPQRQPNHHSQPRRNQTTHQIKKEKRLLDSVQRRLVSLVNRLRRLHNASLLIYRQTPKQGFAESAPKVRWEAHKRCLWNFWELDGGSNRKHFTRVLDDGACDVSERCCWTELGAANVIYNLLRHRLHVCSNFCL